MICGHPPGGRLEDYLKKDPVTFTTAVVPANTPGAKWACLEYQPLEKKGPLTLIGVHLITGRSHQIRVQMQHLGCPLWGDARYNPEAKPGQNIALFASSLTFQHPVTRQPLCFEADPEGTPWQWFQRFQD